MSRTTDGAALSYQGNRQCDVVSCTRQISHGDGKSRVQGRSLLLDSRKDVSQDRHLSNVLLAHGLKKS